MFIEEGKEKRTERHKGEPPQCVYNRFVNSDMPLINGDIIVDRKFTLKHWGFLNVYALYVNLKQFDQSLILIWVDLRF